MTVLLVTVLVTPFDAADAAALGEEESATVWAALLVTAFDAAALGAEEDSTLADSAS
jgi:hypothetical protein